MSVPSMNEGWPGSETNDHSYLWEIKEHRIEICLSLNGEILNKEEQVG